MTKPSDESYMDERDKAAEASVDYQEVYEMPQMFDQVGDNGELSECEAIVEFGKQKFKAGYDAAHARAEREIAELKDENRRLKSIDKTDHRYQPYHEMLIHAEEERDTLRLRVRRLEEALRFYGHESGYIGSTIYPNAAGFQLGESLISRDSGAKARQALKSEGEVK